MTAILAGMSPAPARPTGPTGLRARRKASTRAALTSAAQRLVGQRGFDEVTVGDIARAADVSHRTFYRYFASKEDALVAPFRDFMDEFVGLVAARPPDEHPIDSLLATNDAIAAVLPVDPEAFGWMWELLDGVPAVRGAQHALLIEAQDRLTALFAARLGVPAASLEPRLFAAAATGSFQASTRTWVAMPSAERTMTVWALGREALERFAAGLRPQPPLSPTEPDDSTRAPRVPSGTA